ncbi:MAG: hypothetical protein ACFE98_01405 [Candidatus Hermodarchaeota archaeon]
MSFLQPIPFRDILARWNKQSAIPLNIQEIDDVIGGLLPCYIHNIIGYSGVGKTWFCIRAIDSLFKGKSDAKILFSDFCGNLRISNLRKLFPNPSLLQQVIIIQPTNLFEQIVFFRKLLENSRCPYDLIILDSLFGSPLHALQYFYKNARPWEKRIFFHLHDLSQLAMKNNIPILMTNHLIYPGENFNPFSSLNQHGGYLVEQFAPIEILIRKIDQTHCLELRIFQEIAVYSNFVLIPHKFNKNRSKY